LKPSLSQASHAEEASVVIAAHGLSGVSIDRGATWEVACQRHERLLAKLDASPPKRLGSEILLRMLADVPILTLSDLQAAASVHAALYMCGGQRQIEWPRGEGWIDRRQLGGNVVDLINRNGGVSMQPADWSGAVAFLRQDGEDVTSRQVWQRVIADARAWWLDRLPTFLFAHVADVQRMQPLPRAAWARRRLEQA
jgi:hypothetical protein